MDSDARPQGNSRYLPDGQLTYGVVLDDVSGHETNLMDRRCDVGGLLEGYAFQGRNNPQTSEMIPHIPIPHVICAQGRRPVVGIQNCDVGGAGVALVLEIMDDGPRVLTLCVRVAFSLRNPFLSYTVEPNCPSTALNCCL